MSLGALILATSAVGAVAGAGVSVNNIRGDVVVYGPGALLPSIDWAFVAAYDVAVVTRAMK